MPKGAEALSKFRKAIGDKYADRFEESLDKVINDFVSNMPVRVEDEEAALEDLSGMLVELDKVFNLDSEYQVKIHVQRVYARQRSVEGRDVKIISREGGSGAKYWQRRHFTARLELFSNLSEFLPNQAEKTIRLHNQNYILAFPCKLVVYSKKNKIWLMRTLRQKNYKKIFEDLPSKIEDRIVNKSNII